MKAVGILNEAPPSPTKGLDSEAASGATGESHGTVTAEGDFSLVHGAVTVPGADCPVEYSIGVPSELKSAVVHLIVPGFGGVKRSSRGLRNALAAQEGIAAISLEPVRGSRLAHDLFHPQKVHTDTLTAILQDLPDNEQLNDVPGGHELDLSQAVLLPHSIGSMAATERGRLYPDETEAVIYMGSVGLEARVMFGFVGRLAKSASGDVAGKYATGKLVPGTNRLDLAYRTARYYLTNLGRTGGEIGSCFAADLRQKIGLLDILGVKTAALYFNGDRLVPPEDEALEAARALVHLCEVMDGGHLAPQRRPGEVAARIGNISARLAQI